VVLVLIPQLAVVFGTKQNNIFCEFVRYMNRSLAKHIQITPLTAASPATAARKDGGVVKQHRDNA
jgi:hypothetical protein